MRWTRLLAGSVLFAAAATGCTVEVTFDPLGSDFSVAGQWTVDGEVPSAANCGAAGIDRVRVVFYDSGDIFTYDFLDFPCAQGSFTTGMEFAWGNYQTQWQAIDASGRVVAESDRLTLNVLSPTTSANLAPADFVVTDGGFDPLGSDFSVAGQWTINGTVPSQALCDSVGIAYVRVVFYDAGSMFVYDDLVFDCETGAFNTAAILAYGSYTTQWQAIDASGNVIAESGVLDLIVDSPLSSANLAPADFIATPLFTPLGTDASFEFSWTIDGGLADAKSCPGAGVAFVELVFYADTDTELANGVSVQTADCVDGTYSSAPTTVLANGSYQWALFFVDASDNDVAVSDAAAITVDSLKENHVVLPTIDLAN